MFLLQPTHKTGIPLLPILREKVVKVKAILIDQPSVLNFQFLEFQVSSFPAKDGIFDKFHFSP